MIYFIFGEDSYRSKEKLGEIISGYKQIHKSGLNLIYINAKESSFRDFFNNFRTTSMFAEKKLVILKNVFYSVKFQEEFLEELKKINDLKDIVVIYEDGADDPVRGQGGSAYPTRKRTSNGVDQRTKFFKTLQKHAKCQEFKFLQPAPLKKWILDEFTKNKAKIDSGAQSVLLGFAGNNLWQMANEINKLSNYKRGSVITKQDVELLVRPNIENDIFKTIDALASKDKKQALNLLHKHIENGDNCLYLLSMIAYQFRNLLIIKELQDAQKPYPVIAKMSGLHPFVVRKSYYLCNRFSYEELKKIYRKIFQIDSDIKTGKIEPETALDMLIAEI
ncbi:MAG: DNA polymerase III subunit delta [bacterium]